MKQSLNNALLGSARLKTAMLKMVSLGFVKIGIMNISIVNVSLATCILSFPALANDAATLRYQNAPAPIQTSDLNDQDQDGVINARDRCPMTPIGALVDNDGCSDLVNVPISLDLVVYFAHDSDFIAPLFQRQVSDIAQYMLLHPSLSISLKGFASQPGANGYNLSLAQQRAERVQGLLIDAGIAKQRITIHSYGETHLVQAGNSPISQALNRRVVSTIHHQQQQVIKEWTIFTTRPKR